MTHDPTHPDEAVVAGAGEGPGAAPEAAAAPEQDPIADLERQRDEYLDHLRRLAADFDNYKKRQARLAEQQTAQAGARILRALLPVLDDLERSLDELAKAGVDESLRRGVALTASALRAADRRCRRGHGPGRGPGGLAAGRARAATRTRRRRDLSGGRRAVSF